MISQELQMVPMYQIVRSNIKLSKKIKDLKIKNHKNYMFIYDQNFILIINT